VINAEAPARAAVGAAGAVGRIDAACAPKLFSEDFAHFANARRACFMLMGNGVDGAHARPLHSADYDFNDAALTIGADYWVRLVEQRLG
jgi:hippurate hydrolase